MEERAIQNGSALYIVRTLHRLAPNQSLRVLDFGCGDGGYTKFLADLGHDAYGCELPGDDASRRSTLSGLFGGEYEHHIRVASDEALIPFEDEFFDVVVAYQVFEHIRLSSTMVGECARILKPDGVLIAILPLAPIPVEPHTFIPFAHWIPAGKVRVAYLRRAYSLISRLSKERSEDPQVWAESRDRYLRDETYYRFLNENLSVGTYHFVNCEVDTLALIDAKRRVVKDQTRSPVTVAKSLVYWMLVQLGTVGGPEYPSSIFSAAIVMRRPRQRTRNSHEVSDPVLRQRIARRNSTEKRSEERWPT